MASLEFTQDADDEMERLYTVDPDAVDLIDVLVEQLVETPGLLDSLCAEKRHVAHRPSFQVKRFQELWRKKYTIYILKIWPEDGPALGYRVLYAHHPQKNAYYVLAIMDRDINYEADPHLIQRLCDAYENLGIPRY